ncbi:DUF72 domain-containing protein [Nocardia stercoris]|uniref:DUF72 domain-containing protein n=1 Tax=Nocardia stercoris TaxID=2483361 RepID=A0A3M2LK92_9NOCA|nr:DUF72 domain-containing protein [Nocardia stercoris]RMI35178.1 DUF72 domain-containing protein [Nocardia stercoris]
MRLAVGCAMFTHPAWQDWQPGREKLRAYAQRCTAVEGNTTFYAVPSVKTTAAWAAQTPEDFRFAVKIHRTVTHDKRLTGVETEMREFLAAVEPLGSRVHPLWVQLPPSFGPSELAVLGSFLRRLPRDYPKAVEVRHPAFFENPRAAAALVATLDSAGAEWLTFDTTVLFEAAPGSAAEREASAKKPRVPRLVTALTDHPVVRYHGRDAPEPTIAGWQPWIATVVEWLREGRSPTVFLHTPDNASSLDLARRFHEAVRAEVPELDPLPEPAGTEPFTLF